MKKEIMTNLEMNQKINKISLIMISSKNQT